MERLPDFLGIGAMKCGTTSLYFDLASNPAICLADKENRNDLLSDRVLTPAGRAAYARSFDGVDAEQLCGDISSAYTKLPDYPGVARRALELCGDDLKLIYLVREPVARIVSHHYHDVTFGTMIGDIDRAVRERSCLLDYSRYAMQLAPWLEAFGRDRLLVVRFERFVGDRRATIDQIASFLGVESRSDLIEPERVYNRSRGKYAQVGPIWRFSRGGFYQRRIRPLLPLAVREWLVHRILPKAPPPPAPPSPETVDWILESLAEDLDDFQRILGLDRPVWELSEVRRKFAMRQG